MRVYGYTNTLQPFWSMYRALQEVVHEGWRVFFPTLEGRGSVGRVFGSSAHSSSCACTRNSNWKAIVLVVLLQSQVPHPAECWSMCVTSSVCLDALLTRVNVWWSTLCNVISGLYHSFRCLGGSKSRKQMPWLCMENWNAAACPAFYFICILEWCETLFIIIKHIICICNTNMYSTEEVEYWTKADIPLLY